VSRQEYDPFGGVIRSGSSWWPARGFAGYLAPEIGLEWMTVYRAYSSDTARWLSEDPLGVWTGVNYYQYVNNQPISSVDPLGLFKMRIPPGVGKEGCEYYKRRCDETTRECDDRSSDPYACGAYKCCRSFGEDNVQNCTRSCLIESDPSCSSRSPAARWTCRMTAHLVCYNRCGMVPIARVEWLPPLNCIATGFGF
jgi:RHS repeat-associated protein